MSKTVFITGANGTIGFETAKQFGQNGWKLILSCRAEHCDELTNKIEQALKSGEMEFVPQIFIMDLLDDQSIEQVAVDMIDAGIDWINVLINNAGALTRGKLENISIPEIDAILDINLRGPMVLLHHIIPLISPSGKVINISSDASVYGRPDLPAYIAAKAGLIGLSLAMNRDYPFTTYAAMVGWTCSNMSDFNPAAQPASFVAEQLFKIATNNTGAPENCKLFGIGPVFQEEELPKIYPLCEAKKHSQA